MDELVEKVGENGQGETITITVVSQDGNRISLRTKKTTQFRTLMRCYLAKGSIVPGTIRFLLDGRRLTDDQTPQEVGMEDKGMIDAVAQQIGGNFD
jgi:small ubiquitin-related modifier